MPDVNDPVLLRLMSQNAMRRPTPGAGAIPREMLGQLMRTQPMIIGGGPKGVSAPTVPKGPQFPANAPTGISPEEGMQELQTQTKYNNAWNNSKYGTVPSTKIGDHKAIGEAFEKGLQTRTANDPVNPMQSQLEALQRGKLSDQQKYDTTVQSQLAAKRQAQTTKPDNKSVIDQMGGAAVLPMGEQMPRRFTDDEIKEAAAKIKKGATTWYGKETPFAANNYRDANQVQQYNQLHDNMQEDIRDYHLARTNMDKWASRRIDRYINSFEGKMDLNAASKAAGREIDVNTFRVQKIQELNQEIQQMGQEKFYTQLKDVLGSTLYKLKNAESLISKHIGEKK